MALPAIPVAVKAAILAAKDERTRTAVLTLVAGIVLAIVLPILLLFSVLLTPMSGLFGFMSSEEAEMLSAFRGEYGLDQYITDADYLEADAVDYSGVSFSDGQTEVTYYNQMDARWKDLPYGGGTIGRTGCGPTALAMGVSSQLDIVIDPVEMSAWAFENGYEADGNGSYHALIPEGAAYFGLTAEGCADDDPQRIVDALASGKLVVAIMGPGHFTKSGHFIVLRGVTAEGDILVADPVSVRRSEQAWALEIVLTEARKNAGAGGPFWILSP